MGPVTNEWWEVRCLLSTFGGQALNPDLYLTVAYEDAVTHVHRESVFDTLAEAQVFVARQKMRTRVVHCVLVTEG